jgi:hypothetical protein
MTEIYNKNPRLKSPEVEIQWTEETVREYKLCMNDPIYFIRKYVKIINLDEGLVPFELYDFQEQMINTFSESRFTICKMARQSGKSITCISFFLHQILFNSDISIAILANKLSTARELLGRLQRSYENLPFWLQQGVIVWNRTNIELENGCKILASATSSSAVRGSSFNILFLDEFAFVPNEMAEDFFRSVYPTISSGKSTKVIIVSTPYGMNHFYKLWNDSIHKRNSYENIEVHWSELPGRDAEWKQTTINNTSELQFQQEFECDFLGSSNTLITGSKLKSLSYMNPIKVQYDGTLFIYHEPIINHIYWLTVDVSRARGSDYSAFSVLDVTELPYVQVATYRSNEIPPLVYPNIIKLVADLYNESYILVEINDIGAQVSDILHSELEYPNMIYTKTDPRKGQFISNETGKNINIGVRTTKATKKTGCFNLKSLIEEDKLIVNDFNTIDELSSFISKGLKFEADSGRNDDLVDTLVLFSWATTDNYFKDLSDINIREELYKERVRYMEEQILPFGFINNKEEKEITMDNDGNIWESI